MAYCIDLDKRNPRVLILDGEELDFDLEYFGKRRAVDLTTYDRRVFNSIPEASQFLEKYEEVENSLTSRKLKRDPSLPNLLYKRRYMILTIMGLKLETSRHFNKKWKPGQLIQLYDQTYFLTVRLKKITEVSPKEFRYEFENL